MKFALDNRIAVTGTGICTAIGDSPEEVTESLIAGRSGIQYYHGDGRENMISRLAAIHHRFELDSRFPKEFRKCWDRATQMAAVASLEAFRRSNIQTANLKPQRIGMAVGVSGAGQFAPNRDYRLEQSTLTPEVAELVIRKNVPHFQLYQLARFLKLAGPMTCVCSASAGSGIAIGNAMRWLLSNKADAVVAGGGEAVMLLNYLGFDTLGLLSPTPCSPFSECNGMNMGEGAAYVMLERYTDAVARNAEIRGVLLGFGVSSDGFDPILYDPTGDGIRRAMEAAIEDAQIKAADVDWIRSSGAGGKDQDASEIMAIRSVFDKAIPIVTSTEANFGHCNGAGPAIGVVSAVELQKQGWISPTLHYKSVTFPGIDFVPNKARKKEVNHYLSTTAAFGGSNVVIVGGSKNSNPTSQTWDDVVISGIGIVSKFGCSNSSFTNEIKDLKSFISPFDRGNSKDTDASYEAGLVDNFAFRKEVPSIPSRGMDLLTQYAVASAKKALQETESHGKKIDSLRLGVATGVAYTSGSLLEKLFDEIQGPWATPTVGRTLLNKGRFLVTSRLACWLGCKGYNATHSGGIGCGLMALNQAYEQLRQSPGMDAILVVASDEVSKVRLGLTSKLGWLASKENPMQTYNAKSGGMTLGEGAVAIVLEKRSSLEKRGGRALASIEGTATNLDPFDRLALSNNRIAPSMQLSKSSDTLIGAIVSAIQESNCSPDEIDLVLGNAFGIPSVDQREKSAIDGAFSEAVPFGSASTITGVMASSGSLFNVALAVAAMHEKSACDVLDDAILLPNRKLMGKSPSRIATLVSSEDGQNVVTVLKKEIPK